MQNMLMDHIRIMQNNSTCNFIIFYPIQESISKLKWAKIMLIID